MNTGNASRISCLAKLATPGVTASDNRLFVNAVLWITKTGAPWRDFPERFGNWNSVWRRFDRWSAKGVWLRIFEELNDTDLEWLILDSTVIRAHQHAAGAKKRGPRSGVGALSGRVRDQAAHRRRRAGKPRRVHTDRGDR
ncbi:IS5 family transposase [Singulisphaera sp. GP187]|uniref:IS5 family transposase n=1 Tax=Singulisphaera sp. GP187 TaxID=1882752 RepID=UPI000940D7BB